jgi:dipeptidyl aminopeptidase/acylaminoacyl peptidase
MKAWRWQKLVSGCCSAWKNQKIIQKYPEVHMMKYFTPSFSRLFLLLTAILGQASAADMLRDIQAEDLIVAPSIRAIQLSPKEDLIVFEKRTVDLEANRYHTHLWKMTSEGGNERQLTYSSGNEWNARMGPDGHCIAFLSDRLDSKQIGGTRVWGMPLSGGEAKPLTDPKRDIIDYKWSSDGSHIYYLTPALPPDAAETWKKARQKSGYDAADRTHEYPKVELWKVNKSTAVHTRLFVGDPGISAFDISPDDATLVYSTNYTGDPNDWIATDLFTFSIADSSAPIQLTDDKGVEEAPRFSTDGKYIAYQTVQDHRKPFSQAELKVYDLDLKTSIWLTRDLDLGIAMPQWYRKDKLLVEVLDGLNNHLYIISMDGSATAISGGSAYIYRAATAPGKREICAVRQTSTELNEIIYTKQPGQAWTPLTQNSAALSELRIHPQTTFKWMSRDQRFKLEGLVVLPHFSGEGPLPLIVDIHGGPAGRTDMALEQGALYQAWASEGFAVFSPNFRGSEGYGNTFQVANYRDLGGSDYHDIMAGIKDLIKRGVAHPDSLVIMGGSYGGYMTNWIITQTNQFKAAISRYGIFDLRSDFSNSIYSQWELDYVGKPYWEDPAAYRRMSPASFIKRAKTPTLILHGGEDENTHPTNSMELAKALKTLDVPHRFFVYPREGHGMNEPIHRLDVFERQVSWVNEHLERQSPLTGEDWLSQDLRVQIVVAQKNQSYLNRGDQKFTSVKLFLDGSRLERTVKIKLSDISLLPGNLSIAGLPSGRYLLPPEQLIIELGPHEPVLELEVVFPRLDLADQQLRIRSVGLFALPF